MICKYPDIAKLLEQYLLNRLNPSDRIRFEDHLFECKKCRQDFHDEVLAKSFTRKHRSRFAETHTEATSWVKIKSLFDSIIDNRALSDVPVMFRNSGISRSGDRNIQVYTINLKKIPEIEKQAVRTKLLGNELAVYPFHPGFLGHDVYLLITKKTDFLSLFPNTKFDIPIIVDQFGKRLLEGESLDSQTSEIINRSLIVKGLFRKNGAFPDQNTCNAIVNLAPIELVYLFSPDYISMIVLW